MKKYTAIFTFTSIFLFACNNKYEYSDEAKGMVLLHSNIYNLSIKFDANKELSESTQEKQVDCLCYVDKIQRKIKQKEYMQNYIDPSNNKEVHDKIVKIFKSCELK